MPRITERTLVVKNYKEFFVKIFENLSLKSLMDVPCELYFFYIVRKNLNTRIDMLISNLEMTLTNMCVKLENTWAYGTLYSAWSVGCLIIMMANLLITLPQQTVAYGKLWSRHVISVQTLPNILDVSRKSLSQERIL